MPENSTGPGFSLDEVDFDAFYQGKPPVEGVQAAFEVTPWDIGEAQQVVVELARSGQLRGAVLDAGCGLGDNAIFLAGQGYPVTGFDGSSIALDEARARARDNGVEIDFVRSDATKLAEFDAGRFDSVLDSALYHCLNEEQQRAYAAALHRVTTPGAQLHVFCFAEEEASAVRMPMGVTQDNLRANLGPHWDIQDIRLARYSTSLTPEVVRQIGKENFESLGMGIDLDRVELDDKSRVTGPVWHLHALRR